MRFLFLTIFIILSLTFSAQNPFKIGFLGTGLEESTSVAVKSFLTEKAYEVVDITNQDNHDFQLDESEISLLWIYQLDQNLDSYRNGPLSDAIKAYVKNGGHLVLSMEAVSLLNDWNIEDNTFEVREDTIRDEGFGRPLGFHSFKSHPIFEGMEGGAYTSKAKADHIVRKIGFFDEELPASESTKVIGIEWTYITFHEKNKLVLEYQFGSGKIIAVGAYTYFGMPNYNIHELNRFYQNIFTYLTNPSVLNDKTNYWSYEPQRVIPKQYSNLKRIDVPAGNWHLEDISLELSREKAQDVTTVLTGREMMVIGKERGGIDEIWTHPFMAFRDIKTAVFMEGVDSWIWLETQEPVIKVSPEQLVRIYDFGNSKLKEITTLSVGQSLGGVHYEWVGNEISKIAIRHTSNFRYMWPYASTATGSITYHWDEMNNIASASAQDNSLSALVAFNEKPFKQMLGQFDDFELTGDQIISDTTQLVQVSGCFLFETESLKDGLSAYFYSEEGSHSDPVETLRSNLNEMDSMLSDASAYYRSFLNQHLNIHTPDTIFNQGYQWAMVRTNQLFQQSSAVGTSMVAGLGSTERGWDGGQKVNGRPGYAWYFGRDAEWCAFAVNGYGRFQDVRKVMDAFERFQHLNGKIFHELTTSGAVHYDASDATPLYLVLAAHYLKYSGDIDYIKQKWPSLQKALDYCYSTDTDGDGLIEITNVGHGWVEGGPLFGTHTEVYLAGCWAAALEGVAYICNAMGNSHEAIKYKSEATAVKKKIDQQFWNSEKQYFYVGLEKDGNFRDQETVLSAVPIYLDAVIDTKKARMTTSSFASHDYSTDWGVRILPASSEKFNPRSYHGGMVWPLFSGWASLSEYKTGLYTSGFTHLMNNLLVYDDWALGSVEETLHGSIYQPAGVCSQQGWSETMVLQPVYEGMLGFVPDAMNKNLSLAPRFPWNWDTVAVENIPYAEDRIHFEMYKTEKETTFHFKGNNIGGYDFNFKPAFPPGTRINEVLVDGKPIKFTSLKDVESIIIALDLKWKDDMVIKVQHSGGIGVLPLIHNPKPGSENVGAKIINQEYSDSSYLVVLEGIPGSEFNFKLFSNQTITSVLNGQIKVNDNNIYTIQGIFPEEKTDFVKMVVEINFD